MYVLCIRTVQYRSRVRCVCCVLVQYSTGAELGVFVCVGTVQYRSRVRCVCVCELVQYCTGAELGVFVCVNW